jgi:Pentapeptide repeats (8 copies)
MAPLSRLLLPAVFAAVGVAIAVVVLKFVPPWLAGTEGLSRTDEAEEIGRARTALLALGAAILATVGAVYTARSFSLSRQGQITDRFTKAVEQLGREELSVRLGGVYALERIARDSPEDQPQIMEVLTAFVRERAPELARPRGSPLAHLWSARSTKARASAAGGERPATDVQAVLAVLGRRELKYDRFLLDLSETNLRGARLAGAKLQRVKIEGAVLEGVELDLSDRDVQDPTDLEQDFDRGTRRGALLDANFDDATKLPEGVTAADAVAKYGARKVPNRSGESAS